MGIGVLGLRIQAGEEEGQGLYDIWKKDRRLVHHGSFAIVKFAETWQAATALEALGDQIILSNLGHCKFRGPTTTQYPHTESFE